MVKFVAIHLPFPDNMQDGFWMRSEKRPVRDHAVFLPCEGAIYPALKIVHASVPARESKTGTLVCISLDLGEALRDFEGIPVLRYVGGRVVVAEVMGNNILQK
jgi:hypothetical protein